MASSLEDQVTAPEAPSGAKVATRVRVCPCSVREASVWSRIRDSASAVWLWLNSPSWKAGTTVLDTMAMAATMITRDRISSTGGRPLDFFLVFLADFPLSALEEAFCSRGRRSLAG